VCVCSPALAGRYSSSGTSRRPGAGSGEPCLLSTGRRVPAKLGRGYERRITFSWCECPGPGRIGGRVSVFVRPKTVVTWHLRGVASSGFGLRPEIIHYGSTAPQTSISTTGARVEATSWSQDFVLQDALSDAVTQLRAAAGFRKPRRWSSIRGGRNRRAYRRFHPNTRGIRDCESCLKARQDSHPAGA